MNNSQPEDPRPSISDGYQDLLAPLDERYRRSLVRRLAQGFYEGWQPTRRELAAVIAEDTGQRGNDRQIAAPASEPRSGAAASPVRLPPVPAGRSGDAAIPLHRRGAPTSQRTRSRGQSTTAQQHIATFQVDCGQLAPGYRFVARSLNTAGMVERGNHRCRLVFLTYELLPILGAGEQQPPAPVIFTAPIICFPDQLVPWADDDGQDRHHKVAGNRVVGRRGPWPLAGAVRRVQFTISEQPPAGVPPLPTPAGRLIVDIHSGNAAWRTALSEGRGPRPRTDSC